MLPCTSSNVGARKTGHTVGGDTRFVNQSFRRPARVNVACIPYDGSDCETPALSWGESGAGVAHMQMPEMDGLVLVREVRARGVHVPVILMTAHDRVAVKALQGGAASYVPKRSLVHALVATVEDVIELARAAHTSLRVLSRLDRIETRLLIDNDASAIPVIVGRTRGRVESLKHLRGSGGAREGARLRGPCARSSCSRRARHRPPAGHGPFRGRTGEAPASALPHEEKEPMMAARFGEHRTPAWFRG